MAKELLIFILLAVALLAYGVFSYVRYRRRVAYHRQKLDEEERRRAELGLGPRR